MFPPLDILFEYWIEHVTFRLLYVMFTFPTRIFYRGVPEWGKYLVKMFALLNGKNGTAITNPKDIANEHAAAFTDNSSSAHYSATFKAIKEREEKIKIDFTSDNTEVYNKPFRLRDLRWSIMKSKPRALGPDGIHNNLLKHLPEDTLKILNKLWTSADFPHQWRAATVIPIPKPNKNHTNPLSYRPIALTSCLCKVLERMINTHFIWYLEKSRILDKRQCGFRKHCSTTDHLVSLSWGPPTACHHCGQTMSIYHMLLECAVLQKCRDYTAGSLNTLFETITETCIVEFLREAGFRHSIQLSSWITPDLMEFVNLN